MRLFKQCISPPNRILYSCEYHRAVSPSSSIYRNLKPGANESQKTRNKKQNGLAHSRLKLELAN